MHIDTIDDDETMSRRSIRDAIQQLAGMRLFAQRKFNF